MSDQSPIDLEVIALCQDALRLPIESFREQLFASALVQTSPQMREALMAINNRAESNRKLRNLVAEIAELSDRFITDDDRDQSLGRVLSLARQLLGTDAAFVVEHDEVRGCGTILLSSGVWTTEFQESEPIGQGIFFEILDVESPLQVANYLRDKSFTHHPDLDSRVKREGFRAFLGIPFFSQNEPTRVLFVADRHERIYHSGDIFILEQLALQASMVIRLFQQRQTSMSALEEVRENLEAAESEVAVIRSRTHHLSQVIELAEQPNFSSKIARYLSRATGLELEVVSLVQLNRATGTGKMPKALTTAIVNHIQKAPNAGHWGRVEVSGRSRHVWAVFFEGRPWGAVLTEGQATNEHMDLLVRAAHILSVGSLGSAEERARIHAESSNAFFNLFHFGYDQLTQGQRSLVKDRDIQHRGLNRVAIIEGDAKTISDLAEKIHADAGPRTLVGIGQEQIGLVGKLDRVPAVLGALRQDEGQGLSQLGVTVFCSEPFDSLDKATQVFQKAQHFVRIISNLGLTTSEGWFTEATIPQSLQLLSRLTVEQRNALIRDSIGPILDYDRKHRTDLVETAKALVQNQFSVSSTASELYVHVNTVRHRMRKIDQLLGPTWNAGLRLLDFQLAVSLITLTD